MEIGQLLGKCQPTCQKDETWQCTKEKLCLNVQALVEGHMLNSNEEASLRESLRFREEDRWLHLLYRFRTFSHAICHLQHLVSEMAPACTSLIHLDTELQPESPKTCACCQNLWPAARANLMQAKAHSCAFYLREERPGCLAVFATQQSKELYVCAEPSPRSMIRRTPWMPHWQRWRRQRRHLSSAALRPQGRERPRPQWSHCSPLHLRG